MDIGFIILHLPVKTLTYKDLKRLKHRIVVLKEHRLHKIS